jgi:hypothetical protein
MSITVISLLVAGCIFAGGLAGLYLHPLLPADHQSKETQDVVKLGIGMLSVLASLVLGLLIATAKTSYDAADHAVRSYAAELALLNETLRDYGGTASVPRDLLRTYTEHILQAGWPTDGARPAGLADDASEPLLEHVRESIRALKPIDDGQRSLQVQAADINVNLLRQRWLLIEQQGPSVQRVVLVILVSWVTVIFASFGMNAPRNGTVVAVLLICSLAIGGAIFLILEMDRPMDGIMQISSWPLRNALAQMKW